MAVGTSTGHVLLYDLRSSGPLLTRDHRYGAFAFESARAFLHDDERSVCAGLPIRDLKFHARSRKVISTDSKIIKIWDKSTVRLSLLFEKTESWILMVSQGDAFTSIEPTKDINDVCVVQDSGLLFAAGELLDRRPPRRLRITILCRCANRRAAPDHDVLHSAAGPGAEMVQLPRLAHRGARGENRADALRRFQIRHPVRACFALGAVLDILLCREQLESWGATHLIGTDMLKAYMHGFFMDHKMYAKLKVASFWHLCAPSLIMRSIDS